MSRFEAGGHWGDRRVSRRRLVRAGAIGASGLVAAVAVSVGGLAACEKTLNYLANQGGYGEPREGREIQKLKLSPVPNNMQKMVGPFVRKRPNDGAEIISSEELSKQGVDINDTVGGIKWWGGSYPGYLYEGGLVPKNDRGVFKGKWAAIVDKDGKVVGFVSENFVTYLPEEK